MNEPDANRGTDADAEPGDEGAAAAGSTADPDVLDSLFATIESRGADLPAGSYTASLFTHKKGENAVLEKLGEESTELILAAKDDDLEALRYESADFVYHLLVLFAMKGLSVEDLRAELESRF